MSTGPFPRCRVSLLGFFLLSLSCMGILWPSQGRAQGEDVVLENVAHKADGRTVSIRRVTVTGSSLSRSELEQLLAAGDLSGLRRLSARRVEIPEIEVSTDEGIRLRLQNIELTGLAAGQAASVTIGALEGNAPAEKMTFSTERITAADANLTAAIGVAFGRRDYNMARFGLVSLVNLAISVRVAGDDPGRSVRIGVAHASVTSQNDGNLSLRFRYQGSGIVVEPATGTEGAMALSVVGLTRAELEFAASGSYNPTTKVLDYSEFVFRWAAMGAFGVRFRLADVGDATVNFDATADEVLASLAASALQDAEIAITDDGILAKVVGIASQRQGKSEADLKGELTTRARQTLPMLLGKEAGDASAAAIARFLNIPGSTLRIAVKSKGAPVPLASFGSVTNPAELLAKIDISATAGP